ncbi:MAG: hypothetical protein IIC80_02665 [Chloroflexi bacterium]|nr:hypothetical protein [Chloroflexota bacterium]
MANAEGGGDLEWTKLADLDEGERAPLLVKRYQELFDLPEKERVSRLVTMEEAVYKLPEEKIRILTISRFRVWLNLEHELGQVISKSYDAVSDTLPGPIAMRHIALVQTLSREFSAEEQDRLRMLFPRIFGSLPSVETVKVAPATPAPDTTAAAPAKKPWWAFWRS